MTTTKAKVQDLKKKASIFTTMAIQSHHCQTYPYLEFYKVYVPEFSSDKLQVPPSFVSHLIGKGKTFPDKVFLRSRHRRFCRNKMWVVEVDRQGKGGALGVYFGNGWESFVSDLDLKLGDVVTFGFNGDVTFYVTVFGTSMIEKEDLGTDNGGDGDDGDDDDDDDDFGINVGGFVRSKKNLYFVSKLRPVSHSRLHVPLKVVKALKERDLKMDEKVVLRDWDGKEWTVKVTTWADGRVWIAGCKDFWKKKRLGADDKFICELVPQDGEKTINLVLFHIVRA